MLTEEPDTGIVNHEKISVRLDLRGISGVIRYSIPFGCKHEE